MVTSRRPPDCWGSAALSCARVWTTMIRTLRLLHEGGDVGDNRLTETGRAQAGIA
jgi:hypothetical protein